MHKEIESYLASLLPEIGKAGVCLSSSREISYGVQLVLCNSGETCTLNIYYSSKKGISTVLGGRKDCRLYSFMNQILNSHLIFLPELDFHNWNTWLGADESGKGDYLGPLVVSAFWVKRVELPILKKLGVTDSKKLSDKIIPKIAKELYRLFPGRAISTLLSPSSYNNTYASFAQEKKNLNDLLAWLHKKNIQASLKGTNGIEGILIDQFSPSQKVKKLLLEEAQSYAIIERTKAESDPAVAAASIIARYQFLEHKKELETFYELSLPHGAASAVDLAAFDFVKKYSRKRLGEVAKLHFANTLKVQTLLQKEA